MKEKPSKLAALAVYAALMVCKNNGGSYWNATLSKNTGYKEDQIRGMALDFLKFI